MCGIAGLIGLEGANGPSGIAAATARAMAATLVHRGPDDTGVWESGDGSVALAHRRLSILDLSVLGRNPMAWDEGRLQITFNGEIYNFRELRRELENAGHRFRTNTDTEVILAAYDEWGIDCLARFAGMFAFALWDEPRRRLWLVRDRLGKKPLYYARHDGVLRFASELKAIVSDAAFPRLVDADALRLYLRYGYVPAPYTIFAGASKLPPAHYLVCEQGRVSVHRYWDPLKFVDGPPNRTDADAEVELESLLSTAVRQRQLADVPLGAFLSGGVDSSLVVAMMREHSAGPVRTFTIRFDNPEFDEADHAAAVARHLGTEHHEDTCTTQQMLEAAGQLADIFDEPFADSSAVPTCLVARIARRQVTVALSGDGGDELFFGYPRYRYHADAARILALPKGVRHAAAHGASRLPTRRLRRIADVLRADGSDQYARFITWWTADEIFELTGHAPLEAPSYTAVLEGTAGVPRAERPPLLDLVSYLPDDILAKVDRASMAASLEVRSPLLDHRLVEFAIGLPLTLKRRAGTTKWLLRRLLDKRVPRALTNRPKMGFGVPLDDWFRGPLRETMNSYCAGPDLEDLGLDPDPIRRLWAEFTDGRSHRTDLVWQMYTLVAWSRRFRTAAVAAARRY